MFDYQQTNFVVAFLVPFSISQIYKFVQAWVVDPTRKVAFIVHLGNPYQPPLPRGVHKWPRPKRGGQLGSVASRCQSRTGVPGVSLHRTARNAAQRAAKHWVMAMVIMVVT